MRLSHRILLQTSRSKLDKLTVDLVSYPIIEANICLTYTSAPFNGCHLVLYDE